MVLVDSGHAAQYTCDLGFTLDGVSERHCGTDGSGWSDSDPVCGTVFFSSPEPKAHKVSL